MAAALPFSLAYFPMRARSYGVHVKEVVYLLAFLHSLSAARLPLPASPLGVVSCPDPTSGGCLAPHPPEGGSGHETLLLEYVAFGLPLVGSWLVENTDAVRKYCTK